MACLLRKRNLRVSDLNRDEMRSALSELADQLNARNVKAKIYLVGGAGNGARVRCSVHHRRH